jgi:hypothetical protein
MDRDQRAEGRAGVAAMSAAALKTARAEGLLRDILQAATAGKVSYIAASMLTAGVYADRTALLTALRVIKQKAIEGEVLLRSIDKSDEAIETREETSS